MVLIRTDFSKVSTLGKGSGGEGIHFLTVFKLGGCGDLEGTGF